MTFYPNGGGGTLSDSHHRMLEQGSAIAADVIAESGARTIHRPRDLPEVFGRRQRSRAPGVLFVVHRPNGSESWCFRPDKLDPASPGHKYEQPCKVLGGAGNVLDVLPSQRHLIADTSVPVVFVEGTKKMLSLVSAAREAGAALLVVAIVGVWNWIADGQPISDMLDIPLEGRRATVMFDSDMLRKVEVQDATRRLSEYLQGRGAEVFVTYLEDAPDGSKVGADDYFVAGGTLDELRMLTRRYDPSDFVRVRMSRSEKLRAGIAYLWRDWHGRDWMHFTGDAERPNWARGHTARDVKEALIEEAMRGGKQDERGIVIRVGMRRLAELSAKSAPSVGHALGHLAKDEQIEILPAGDKAKARSYRLLVPSEATRATLYTTERDTTTESFVRGCDRRCKGLRAPTAPRFRWSSPATKVERLRGVSPGTRRVRQTRRFHKDVTVEESLDLFPDRPYVKRLGPHRCAILDALEDAGGQLTLAELCEVLHRKRPRDVRRRILPMLVKAEIIEVSEAGDVIQLSADWQSKLEEERERKGEITHAEEQRENHRKQRERYRNYLDSVKHLPSKASRETLKRARERREAGLQAERERAAAAVKAEERRRAEAFIRDRLRELGRIRLALLQDIWRDEGGDSWTIPAAVEALGCRVEELPEFGNRRFVFPPSDAERVA